MVPKNAVRATCSKIVSAYTPPTGPFVEKSSYTTEFKRYEDIRPPVKHQSPLYVATADDRKFQSTTSEAYVSHPVSEIHRPVFIILL